MYAVFMHYICARTVAWDPQDETPADKVRRGLLIRAKQEDGIKFYDKIAGDKGDESYTLHSVARAALAKAKPELQATLRFKE